MTEHASSGTVLGTIPYQKDANDYWHKLHNNDQRLNLHAVA